MPPNTVRIYALTKSLPRAVAPVELSYLPRICYLQSTTSIRTPRTPSPIIPLNRTFATSPILHKKKTRADREAEEDSKAASKSKSSHTEIDDPFDFSALNTGLERNLEKLKNDLAKLRTGGRFNPEVLEDLRVVLSKEGKQTERLGDLAQVLPKGRTVSLLVGEKDHIKPIISSIQASPALNLQPVPDPQNPLAFNISIPPPTKESRDAALAVASKAGETANMGVKNARATCHKRLRAMELKKVVRPDDLRKAGKDMEKIVEKAGVDVKKAVDAAKKGMEQQ